MTKLKTIIVIGTIGLLAIGGFVLFNPPEVRGYSTEDLAAYWKLDDRLPVPILHYKMNDDAATTTVIDETGTNNGTAQQNTEDITTTGQLDKALTFNGTSDWVAIQTLHYDTQGQISELTVSAWVKIPAGGGNWSIVDFDRSDYYTCAAGIPSGSTNGAGDYVGWHTTNSSGGTDDMWSTGTVRDDAWHFIAWVFDGNEVNDKKIYIDGVLDAEKDAETTGVDLGSGVTRYGFLGDGSEAAEFNGDRNNLWYEGSIDEVRIYHEALSFQQIQILYNEGHGTDGDEKTVVDATANHNDGAIKDAGGSPGETTAAHSAVSLHERALTFDGTDDFVLVPDDSTINDRTVYYRSYGIWFKADDTSTRQIIYKEGGISNGFSFYLEGDNLYYGFWGSQINNVWNSVAFTDTASWHYLQSTFDSVGGVQKMYLDGAEVGSSSETGYVPGHVGDISIGGSYGGAKYHDGDSSTNYYFNGRIDEMRIYNRTLSVAEIELHHFLGSETRLKGATIKNAIIK